MFSMLFYLTCLLLVSSTRPHQTSLVNQAARSTMGRHSKLQKQVLALYKNFLRAGKEKPGFLPRIRTEFRKNAQIPRTNVMYIEYLLRRGQRQLEQLRNTHTKQLGAFLKTNLEER